MKKISLCLLAAATALGANDLFQAIRDGREDVVKRLAPAPEAHTARDAFELTPLHYAAAVGTPAMVAALLEAKADVNASARNGSTPLLLAIRDPRKVKMLLDAGANVNAANQDGVTALIAAMSGASGAAETARLLLAKGADPKAVDRSSRSAVLLAYRTGDAAVIAALAKAGAKLEKKEDLGATPLFSLGSNAPIEHIRTALELGADPNEMGRTLTLSFPVLARYANSNRLDAVRLLIARGADVNLRGNKGHTAIMMAAGAVRRNPEMVRTLLGAGADPNIADQQGNNALDWALQQGETELAMILRAAGVKSAASRSIPAPVTEPRTVAGALDKSIPMLVSAAATSIRKVACVNCHNNSLPAIALRAVRDAGLTVSTEAVGHYTRSYEKTTLRRWDGALWNDSSVSYVEWALVEEGYPRGIHTDAIALRALRTQQSTGRWGSDGDSMRPPLSSSAIKTTAFSIRVVDAWTPAGHKDEARRSIKKAAQWLELANAADTQDAAFQLLGLKWAGGSHAIAELRGKLVALQRPDGGWGQMPTMASDVYATGQALHALRVAADVPSNDKAWRRGVDYLLRNQMEDGSWFTATRAFGFQPYYEGGFPHGLHQFMSASASSWATMALTHALEPQASPTTASARKGE